MTMKTKRRLAVGGGTIFCAALAILIATRFAPEDAPITTSNSEPTSSVEVSVQISTRKPSESKPTEKTDTDIPDNTSSAAQITSDPDKEAANFIDSGGIEINQGFPEPEKAESAPQNKPPEPPKIEDEEMLTNPDKEPTYEPEQTEVKPQQETPSDTPKHGDKKDGMIYINGFGWIKDEGGGGRGEAAPDMYENGNKIGYFG